MATLGRDRNGTQSGNKGQSRLLPFTNTSDICLLERLKTSVQQQQELVGLMASQLFSYLNPSLLVRANLKQPLHASVKSLLSQDVTDETFLDSADLVCFRALTLSRKLVPNGGLMIYSST